MTVSPLKPAASALAVFGILLALLSQSVCLAEFLQHPNQIERHGYIRTPDEGRQARESIDVVTTTALDGETRHLAPADTTENKKCRLWKKHIANGKNGVVGDHKWMCAFDDPGLSQTVVFGGYRTKTIVGVGDDNIIEYLRSNGASSGKTILVLSDNVEVLNDKVIVVLDQVIGLEDYNSKEETTNKMNTQIEAAKMTGEQRTLVVRVNFVSNNDAIYATEISDICFTNEEYSLKSQYAKCSYNKFTLQEYIPSSNGAAVPTVAQGVVDITVAATVAFGFDKVEDVEEKSVVEFYKLFPGKNSDDSPEQFDLVIFCFPHEMDMEWGDTLGFAYENGWDSYYQTNECRTNISTLMHEIGHNIGLKHSGEHLGSVPNTGVSEEVYGDGSGMMGYYDGQMCFNTVKSYDLGWYADKYLELGTTISDNTSYKLNGVVDYGDTTLDRYVGIKIENYYIGFNRLADFNIGTQEAGDMVTVTKKLVDGATPFFDGHSNLVKILAVGENFDFEVSDTLIKLKFVGIENDKDAIIEFNSNTGSSDPSGAPSTSPSNFPSSDPSTSPSNFPSIASSSDPSGAPSTSPSNFPSIASSSDPSGAPSGTPSESGHPSTLPSNAPSTSLLDVPSGQPSPVPSTSPKNEKKREKLKKGKREKSKKTSKTNGK